MQPLSSKIRKTTSKTFYLQPNETLQTSNPSSISRKRPHSDDLSNVSSNTTTNHIGDVHSRPSPKRQRGEEWPLTNNVDISVLDGSVLSSPASSVKPSPPHKKRHGRKDTRASKFQEGSLNDKPSKKPPAELIGEENAMESYLAANNEKSKDVVMQDVEHLSGRPTSGVFRFGKALANAFNPVWNGLNGIWRDKEQSNDSARIGSDDQKEDIAKAYSALKAAGFSGMKSTISLSSKGNSASQPPSKRSSFRDSAIDMSEGSTHRPSHETVSSKHLSLPVEGTRSHSKSPGSDANPSRRSFSHLRSPSMADIKADLKKVRSNVQLPSTRRRTSAQPVIPSIDSVISADNKDSHSTSLRRQSSKKDLARVQKLNKRVSDLETKLDAARSELNKSMLSAPPVPDVPSSSARKPFIPGALGSLPSERLLKRHLDERSKDKSPSSETGASFSERAKRVGSWLDVPSPNQVAADHKSTTHGRKSAEDHPHPANPTSPSSQLISAPLPVSPSSQLIPPLPPTPRGSFERADIDRLAANIASKVTDYTSTSHNHTGQPTPRGSSTFLSPPAMSPMRTRSKKRCGISPPPPSLSSAAKKGRRSSEHLDSPAAGKGKGALRSGKGNSKVVKIGKVQLGGMDKPLPEIQRENFDWDEDVF
ncbi:MAG: hypothetical protein OHK93_007305 [Ramalina farinacea]|uniref:Uncharacterized protein n=1 Tax=Ramalina farinacea TaxID=258253 RepID=A0AA43QK80_9LECA|nr:hypothetical protein [Ramalina farinacea]